LIEGKGKLAAVAQSEHNGDLKVCNLADLAKRLATFKERGKIIVHCHGVFDLLHIGHIRHFARARKYGDILVVTLTPDQYVNKGPHRPAFSQELRAEAIAALDCVDYVAINRWPTATEAIEHLKPDFYVKGSDYRIAETDQTGGIVHEERAVKAVGGQLVFTDDITFSSSSLINRHLPIFPPSVKQYLSNFAARYSADRVLGHLEGIKSLKALVVGEAIIDEYQYCEAIGKSSKEPTLAVKHSVTERFAGGALAIANHLAGFCDRVGLITFLGADEAHRQFVRDKLNATIAASLLSRDQGPTILKRRFIESYFFTKMFEVYELDDRPLNHAENRRLREVLHPQLSEYDVVIVADFGHGMMTPEAIDLVTNRAGLLAVNAQSNAANLGYHTITKYPRADYVCLTEGELRLVARDRQSDLKAAIESLTPKLGASHVAVTRGNKGCICYCPNEGFFEVPAFAGEVVDRVGAGDAFLSITSMCAASGVPAEVIGFIGNAVGAQAVAIVGNRTPIQRVALYKHIESLLK
jgi:rfaE bifunctional protein kinase chain/domain/rfaE bifunctional protein nucleotidyltransferase chain/domain